MLKPHHLHYFTIIYDLELLCMNRIWEYYIMNGVWLSVSS